ncbi:hypothetical protein DNTS_029822 [Danionella cerebrum]|uniref:Uncharacterized protein n=1 Tax=Danionella cerebrum TaxID=2873325 RepID=A0A553QRI4_9TELE|nr:hypothetical protein DNTS_029822 [Danionella translucida]
MTQNSAESTILSLLFFWLLLVLTLVFLYKKLNAQTNGQFTVQRLVLGPYGLRDRLRQAVGLVENRFAIRVWPRPRNDDDYDDEQEQENEEDGSIDLREKAKVEMEDETRETSEPKEEVENLREELNEDEAEGEQEITEEVKNEEKVGLLADVKPFAASAIWSEENKDGNDLTVL